MLLKSHDGSRLIINADDFGLTPGINRAIAELHTARALTSATLMATGPAFDDAVTLARALPTLAVGCHIILIDGIPAAPPQSIPTLLGQDGKSFRSSLFEFTHALLRGAIHHDDIVRECIAQIQKLQRAGITVTHLDTHKHTHLFPTVARSIFEAAERCAIPAIRNPFEPPWAMTLGHGSVLRRLQIRTLHRSRPSFLNQLRETHILTTDGTLGISTTGTLTSTTLAEILKALSQDSSATFELCCHPGYNDAELAAIPTRLRFTRDAERQALLTLIPPLLSQPEAPQLIHYGTLGSPPAVTPQPPQIMTAS